MDKYVGGGLGNNKYFVVGRQQKQNTSGQANTPRMVCLRRKSYKDMYKYEGVPDNRLDAVSDVMQRRQQQYYSSSSFPHLQQDRQGKKKFKRETNSSSNRTTTTTTEIQKKKSLHKYRP